MDSNIMAVAVLGMAALDRVLTNIEAEAADLPPGFTRGYLREMASEIRHDLACEAPRPISLEVHPLAHL